MNVPNGRLRRLANVGVQRGKPVGLYFAQYPKDDVRLCLVRLEGQFALAAHVRRADPGYFILLDFAEGQVVSIGDFRYVPYIAEEADFAVEGA